MTSSLLLVSCIDLSGTFQQKDIHRFTQLLSNHLLYDHFDKAYFQLSKKISYQFRDVIHVRIKTIATSNDDDSVTDDAVTTPSSSVLIQPSIVDVQILKKQLKGAVGSFIEDKLPTILANRYNTTIVQHYLEDLIYQYCPQRPILYHCLLDNQKSILREIQMFITNELQSILFKINEVDLPKLFEKTRAQIQGILVHFNQHTMDQRHHRLELKIKEESRLDTNHHVSYYTRNWITPEMIHEFISIVNHTELEDGYTIQHFIGLSTM
ncbi:uncharacterized protein BX663DRAFT_550819 [Cokeromyces recurvatus]|uniref:uncharacterized protein n=1 Tax=Cokeromyces recurvatus TaxID=90255 RepID=UPI00221EED6A|nr:uncharacterized protein BX663DRAFT_550819 [Cokeromyces recurvatus]KAI7904439.1 hypothetical protein BX663DRAFT_550819 [Cokeromyces recurvatus]